MEKKRRHEPRPSEDGNAGTMASGGEPMLLPSPSRKREAGLAWPALLPQPQPQPLPLPQSHEDAGTSRDSRMATDHQNESGFAMSIAGTATQDLDEPVLGRANSVAPASSLDMTFALQSHGDADNRSMGWCLKQNLPEEAFLPRLLRAYDSFYDRYTRLKARKLDVETQFEEQRSSHERFQQVADRYINDLCSENQELRKTVTGAERRIKWLESLLCQKDEFRACGGSQQEVLPTAKCEANVAASPVRPLTPTSDEVGAEESPMQVELHFPSGHVEHRRGEEVAECCVEGFAPLEKSEYRDEQSREIEMAVVDEGLLEIGKTEQSDELQIRTQDNVALQEIALVRGDVQPSPLNGNHHLASTQTSFRETSAMDHVLENPVPELLLGNSAQGVRFPEVLACGGSDNAIVLCSDPSIPCRSNGVGFQDSHSKNFELLDLHRKEVADMRSELGVLQEILGYLIKMTVMSHKIGSKDKPTLILLHPKTGFRFRLEVLKEPEEQSEAAKASELSYKNLSLGTLIGVAPWWMREEIVFTVDQMVNFLRKLEETVTGISNSPVHVIDFGMKI